MAAGMSQRQRYLAQYFELKKLQRRLAKAGVASTYKGRELSGKDEARGRSFSIYYSFSSASNGETFGMRVVNVKASHDVENDCITLRTDAAIDRIISLFRTDVRLNDQGTVIVFDWVSTAARDWFAEHLPADAPKWGRNGYVVERRYSYPIIEGLTEAGLVVA